MTDHVSTAKRSQIMASVKGKHTQPEHAIRKLLHAAGYRFRLHDKKLPGTPDLVLRKYGAVIFVNGCFWHGHGCNLSKKLPDTQKEFWTNKIAKNRIRDVESTDTLIRQGWRVCTIWECALKRQRKLPDEIVLNMVSTWLESDRIQLNIVGVDNTRS